MRPAERVRMLREIASWFEQQQMVVAEVRLVLVQFGIPTGPFPEHTHWYNHLLEQLQDAPDASLLQLYGYAYPDQAVAPSVESELLVDDVSSSLWKPGTFRLFMSHVSAKKVPVAKVKAELATYGIDGFVAHEDIEPTKEWQVVIEHALRSCHAVAAFLTEGFQESRWCDQEVGFALGRGVLVVPVRIGVDPYGLMGRYQGMQGLGKDIPDIGKEIFDILLGHDRTTDQMTEAIVSTFVTSRSYQATRDAWPIVQRITRWTPLLLERIKIATHENSQIRGVDRVVSKVEDLLHRHGMKL